MKVFRQIGIRQQWKVLLVFGFLDGMNGFSSVKDYVSNFVLNWRISFHKPCGSDNKCRDVLSVKLYVPEKDFYIERFYFLSPK